MDNFHSIIIDQTTWKQTVGIYPGLEDCNPCDITKYLNFPRVMATMKANILTGKGYSFTTENKELEAFWNKLAKSSRFKEKLSILAFEIQMHGKSLLGFDKLPNGEWKFFIPDNTFYPRISKAYDEIISVWFHKETITTTDQILKIQEFWNSKMVKRVYYFDKYRIVNFAEMAAVPKQFLLPEEEPNRFNGVIPFHDFSNYEYSSKPDWHGCIPYILKAFNPLMEFYKRELEVNQSRLVFRANKNQAKAIKEGLEDKKDLSYFISIEDGGGDDSKVPVTKVDSNLKLMEITEAIKSQLHTIFGLSGLSVSIAQSDGGNTTATEISVNSSDKTNNIINSRTAMNENMNIALEKLFKLAGFEGVEFTWALNENTAISEQQLLEQVIRRVDSGLMSKVEAIATLDNITIEEATTKAQEIDKELEEKTKMMNEVINTVNNPNGSQNAPKAPQIKDNSGIEKGKPKV